MWRYVRLYANFVRFSFSRALEFRFDFFFRVGMDALWYFVTFAFFKLLYLHTDTVAGWTESQAILLAASMFVSDGIFMTVFANNLWMFPLLINKGDLDYYLVRPVSPLFFLSVRDFAVNSLLNVFLAVGLATLILVTHASAWYVERLPLYVVMLLVGVFIDYLFHLVFLIPVFWMHNNSGLRELSQTISSFSGRPDSIFKGPVRHILLTVVPLILVTSYPTRILFADDPWPIVLHMLAVATGLLAFTVWFWRRALAAYSSASS